MISEVGRIEALFRYPVKSMRGEPLDATTLGYHGLDGDRHYAFRRPGDRAGFPFLTATRLPALLLYTPRGDHVVTPTGEALPLFGEALAAEIGDRLGAPVEMMHLDRGIFDDAPVSVITAATADEVCRLGGCPPDLRRFRPNIVVRSRGAPFEEDDWQGGVLRFGDAADAPAVAVTHRDVRCAMINYDPDTAAGAPEMMRAVVRVRDNQCGVYATVLRPGRLVVGASIYLVR